MEKWICPHWRWEGAATHFLVYLVQGKVLDPAGPRWWHRLLANQRRSFTEVAHPAAKTSLTIVDYTSFGFKKP